MSEVKFNVPHYKVGVMIGPAGDLIQHSPPVTMINEASFDAMEADRDAQRLRADTAEAELALTEKEVEGLQSALGDAEQRIAELNDRLKGLVDYADQLLSGINEAWFYAGSTAMPEEHKDQSYTEAVAYLTAPNPNPEAESHE